MTRTRARWRFDAIAAMALGLGVFAVYVLTLAPTALRSDSGEFHVVPWVLGVAHAPGYPLLTLLGWLAMLVPVGDPAYRVNLLDAAAAAATVACVYLLVVELVSRGAERGWAERAGGLAAAVALGLGATYWQQSVVGGPRPFIFLFVALLLWLLFRWGNLVTRRRHDRAVDGAVADRPSGARGATGAFVLLAFAAGLALAHHPNLLMLFPGLALFVLGTALRSGAGLGAALRPALRAVLLGALALALPLVLYAYLPLRSAMNPPLGPLNLTEPRELLLYVTATHYQDTVLTNCGGSRLIQAQRYLVFLTLQFGMLLPLLAVAGALLTLARAPLAGLGLLYVFGSNAAFGICSSLAMPDYVIPSYIVAAIWIGLGVAWPLRLLAGATSAVRRPSFARGTAPAALAAGLVVGLAAYRLTTGLPYQSMLERTGDFERARVGMAQGVHRGLVLSDWESITPIWYAQHVLGLNRDTKTAQVSAGPTSDRWLVQTEQNLDVRPVALARRVPALGENYRLFPVGSLYEVHEKATIDRATNVGVLTEDRAIRLLGYRLDRTVAAPGDLVRVTLYQKSDRGHDEAYWPIVRLKSDPPVEFRFNPALHYPLPNWTDHEVVGDVYEFSVPAWAPAGSLPLELAYWVEGRKKLVDLEGATDDRWLRIGSLQIEPGSRPALSEPSGTLANFGNQLVLPSARVGRLQSMVEIGPQTGELRLAPAATLDLELRWQALRWLDESYTLFVHLLDGDNRLVAQQDALPLGGIYHTYKWVPGQEIADWYRLPLPQALAPGDYWLEIGAYNSLTTQRLPLLDASGGSDSTSYRWGPIRFE